MDGMQVFPFIASADKESPDVTEFNPRPNDKATDDHLKLFNGSAMALRSMNFSEKIKKLDFEQIKTAIRNGFIKEITGPSGLIILTHLFDDLARNSGNDVASIRIRTESSDINKQIFSEISGQELINVAKFFIYLFGCLENSWLMGKGTVTEELLHSFASVDEDFWNRMLSGDLKGMSDSYKGMVYFYLIACILFYGSPEAISAIPPKAAELALGVFLERTSGKIIDSAKNLSTIYVPHPSGKNGEGTGFPSAVSIFLKAFWMPIDQSAITDGGAKAKVDSNNRHFRERILLATLHNPEVVSVLLNAAGPEVVENWKNEMRIFARDHKNADGNVEQFDFSAAKTPEIFFKDWKSESGFLSDSNSISPLIENVFATASGKQLSNLSNDFFSAIVNSEYDAPKRGSRWDSKEIRKLYGKIPPKSVGEITSDSDTGKRLLSGILRYGTAEQLSAMTDEQLSHVFDWTFERENAERRSKGKPDLTDPEKVALRLSDLRAIGTEVDKEGLLDKSG
ncbi:MAG: hypothetical protein LBB14_02425, partial [Puniceicoccales bacterium]|nr:hypothetical protein [Puniceicoccales bacterium]